METAETLTVRKAITVPAPPERAFELFTSRMADWWPFATHSLHGEAVETAVFEGRAGGRVYELTADGREAEWAIVLEFEPPDRFLLEWRVDPSRPATELEVRFSPAGDGTLVELEHRGWDSEERRSGYDSGWDQVLGRYAEAGAR